MKTENKRASEDVKEIKKEVVRNLIQQMIDDDSEIMVELNNAWAERNKNYDLIYKHLNAYNLADWSSDVCSSDLVDFYAYNLAEDFDKNQLAELLLKGNFNREAKYYRIDDNGKIHTDWGEVIEVEEIVEELLTFGVPAEIECYEFSDETIANALRPRLVEYMNTERKVGITLEESEYILDDESVLFDDWSDDDFIFCLSDSLEDYRSELEN